MMPSKSEINFFDPFSILSSSPVNSLTSMMSSSGNFSDSVSSLLSFPCASSSSNSNSVHQQQHSDSSPVVDEIWKKFDDFILTPPQSPPVKLDFSSNSSNNNEDVDSMLEFADLDFDLSAALDGLLEASDAGLAQVIESFTTNDILRDCMWGGGSSLDGCTSPDDRKCGRVSSSNLPGASTIVSSGSSSSQHHNHLSNNRNSIISQDSTHLLGTSPFSSLCNDMLACEELTSGDSGNSSMADEDEVASIEDSEEDEDESLFVSGSESLIDHSYDGSCHQGPCRIQSRKERKACSTSSSACSSLLYGDCSNSPRKSSLKKCSSKKARTFAQQKKEQLLAPVPVKFVKRSKTLSTSSTSGKAMGVSRSTKKIISDNGKKITNITTSGLTPSGVKRKHQQLQQSAKQCKSTQAAKKCNSGTTVSSSLTPTTTSPTSWMKGAVPSSTSSSTPVSSETSTLTVSLTPSSLSTSILKVNADLTHSASHKKAKASHCYPEKRREHNDSEKKRRDHLRNAFHTLRDQIPKLRENNNKKPPRIIILYEAVNFVNQLTEKSQYLEKVKKQELEKNERLRKKLAALQSSP